jgi:hypothetical protein
MTNVVQIFGIQILLMVLVYYSITENQKSSSGFLMMLHLDVTVTRLICAFLMHLISEPEIKKAISLLKYVLNHSPAEFGI